MKTQIYLFFILAVIPTSLQQCCTKYVTNSKKCAQCPTGTHLYRGSCIIDVPNCSLYLDGFDCQTCKTGYVLTKGECVAIPSNTTNTSSSGTTYTDTQVDVNKSENIFLLSDYAKTIQKDLSDATILWGFVRKYQNGTVFDMVDFQTKSNKYYRVSAQFSGSSSFGQISITELSTKPTRPPAATNSTNSSSSGSKTTQNQTNPFGVIPGASQMTFEDRKTDKGFLAIDALVRSTNKDILGTSPTVITAYYKTTGLNTQYTIYYQTTDKKLIYENKSIYQVLRDKVFVVSLSKTPLR